MNFRLLFTAQKIFIYVGIFLLFFLAGMFYSRHKFLHRVSPVVEKVSAVDEYIDVYVEFDNEIDDTEEL